MSQFQGWLLNKGITDRFVWKAVSDNLCEICRHDGKLLETRISRRRDLFRLGYPANVNAGFGEPGPVTWLSLTLLYVLDSIAILAFQWRNIVASYYFNEVEKHKCPLLVVHSIDSFP